MNIHITDGWVVRAQGSVEVAAPASAVWGQMRDVDWFLTRDPLHARVQRTDGRDASASWERAEITISHRVMGLGPDRVGRVLAWKEGHGFAVSDLSRRGPGVGFPHVCAFRIQPRDERSCRVVVDIRGRWTARWMPRWTAKLWLRWVLSATESRLSADLADFAAWRKKFAPQSSGSHHP